MDLYLIPFTYLKKPLSQPEFTYAAKIIFLKTLCLKSFKTNLSIGVSKLTMQFFYYIIDLWCY